MKTAPLSLTLPRILAALTLLPAASLGRAASPVITISADQIKGHSSPIRYGLMTEEINYSYDGGLYGELIANRAFRDNPQAPDHWTAVQDGGGTGAIAL